VVKSSRWVELRAPGLETYDEPRKLQCVPRNIGEPIAERGELSGGREADAGLAAKDDAGLAE
jgi:hypothetical protein